MVPRRGLATQQHSEKSRITIHHACNATGSHKLPMWIIAKYKRPRCFEAAGLKSVEALGVRWYANKKAWMVTEIMSEWLRWFDNQMAGRKVILLLDNFRAHESAVAELEAMPYGSGLTNIEICWLPRNTTSRLQPLDQGIIASFKAKYRKRWITFMLEQHEIGRNPLRFMNVLKVVQWSIQAWDEVTATTITNCWSHSKINLNPTTPLPVMSNEVHELRQQLQRLQLPDVMDVRSLLDMPEEVVSDNLENLDDHIIDLCSPTDEQESGDEAVEQLPRVSSQQVLQLLQRMKLCEMQSDNCNADYIRWMERYENVVKQRHTNSLEQADI